MYWQKLYVFYYSRNRSIKQLLCCYVNLKSDSSSPDGLLENHYQRAIRIVDSEWVLQTLRLDVMNTGQYLETDKDIHIKLELHSIGRDLIDQNKCNAMVGVFLSLNVNIRKKIPTTRVVHRLRATTGARVSSQIPGWGISTFWLYCAQYKEISRKCDNKHLCCFWLVIISFCYY